MAKKAVRTSKVVREAQPIVIPTPDKDTKRWDDMSAEALCQEALNLLKTIFQQGYMFVKILAYIEQNGKWRDLDAYKEHSFAFFVEDFFNIRPGTYFNMKAVAYRYGAENYNRWGVKELKRIEGTSSPDDTLAELNKLYEEAGGRPSGVKIREVIDSNRPQREVDGVLTPWSIQRAELLRKIQELEDEVKRLRDKVVSLEIKNEQLEDQMKR